VAAFDSTEYVVKTRQAAAGTVTVRVTGKLIMRFTNTDAGKAIVRAEAGPGWGTFAPDGSLRFDGDGHGIGYFSPTDARASLRYSPLPEEWAMAAEPAGLRVRRACGDAVGMALRTMGVPDEGDSRIALLEAAVAALRKSQTVFERIQAQADLKRPVR
jgi:hypothetical protein